MAKENFSVARVETRTRASVGKFERHIERKNESYENMNVDLSRTPMNVSFKGCGELTYNEYLDQMIAAETVSLKGLKPDAKVFDEMIMDVNTEYFEKNGGYDDGRADAGSSDHLSAPDSPEALRALCADPSCAGRETEPGCGVERGVTP